MIDKIEISGNKYRVEESFRKYATTRIGKLDRYLRAHGNKYEISAAMEIPGGKVIAAKDESSNVYAGVDIIEAKLMGQIRRYKLESTPHLQKNKIKSLFKRG